MNAAVGAMGSLIPKLAELLKEEYKLQAGVKKDIEFLERELTSMHVALCKVGEVPRDQLDKQVRVWADHVKELSYRMEDIIDTFLVLVESSEPNPHGRLRRLVKKITRLFKKGKARHQIASAIKIIKEQVQEVAARRERYKVNEITANPDGTTTVDPRLLALYKDQNELVGIDASRDEVTQRLTHGDGDVSMKLKVISIFGFGGLGKTTLAKVVYDKLQAQFDCRAFVPVGRKPSVKKILKDVLLELDKQKYNVSNLATLDERQLINELRGSLENKRYLIVVDDVWDIESWDLISCAFVDGNCASRIITTTRIFEVATVTGEVYKLQPLSPDLSEDLFHARLFGGKGKCPYDHPVEVHETILQKCGGVPLAIITIASLLVGIRKEDWSKVYNSIGFGNEENKYVENTRKILSYSFYDLPCHLRTCLLHLSIFPEDHLIRKDTLLWKWVAEGFAHEEQGVRSFEIAERYFYDLINRSMIQPIQTPHYSSIIIGCRVHDMVLDMIRLLSKEENFVTILDNNGQQTSSRSIARRLAIQNKEQNHPLTLAQVRSFHVTMCPSIRMPSLLGFQVLRVLAIEDCAFANKHPLEHLGKLIHLRYLGLWNTVITELPNEIGNLRFLQTLDLSGTFIKELPPSVGQLRQLKCLHVDNRQTGVPDWIGNLISLEELFLYKVDESPNFAKELGKLRELRKLHIGSADSLTKSWRKALVESLGNPQAIKAMQTSYVVCRSEQDTWEGYLPSPPLHVVHLPYMFPRLPTWISASLVPNLTYLSLGVKKADLDILGGFPELAVLHLWSRVYPDVKGGGAFPKLRFFCTSAMPRFLEGAMPILESVEFQVQVLRDASNTGFDFRSLGNLPLLQKVTAGICNDASQNMDVQAVAEEAVRHAVDIHPNHPILHVKEALPHYLYESDNEGKNDCEKPDKVDELIPQQDNELEPMVHGSVSKMETK